MTQFNKRAFFVISCLLVSTVVVIGKFFTVQVIERKRYLERSKCQTHKREIIPAKRGAILDRKGIPLAISVDDVAIDSDILGYRNNQKYIAKLKRFYPLGEVGGKILGFVGKDGYGLSGIEFEFDKYLHGEDGWVIMQRNGKNYSYRKIGLPEKNPQEGFNVVLTIDSEIQKIVQLTLKEAVNSLKAKGGMCIVMSPSDGAILAMADEPPFNPNLPKKISLSELRSKCIGETYEPGSTFKLITAAVALEEKLKSEQDLIYGDMGTFKIYNEVIRDHKPWGYLTFAKAFTYSSNICFAKVATEIGNERFYRYITDFGFGTKTGIELPGEEAGIVHPVKKWSGRTCVTIAMGQEISVTLLQMVLAYSAIANRGILLKPKIVEKIIDSKGNVINTFFSKPVRRVVSEEVANRLKNMLKDVVVNGTGKNAAILNVSVGGKTGTSQKPDTAGYSKTKYWSSFIGMVPIDEPLLVCGVVIDEPARGEMGGEAAAPVFQKIISQIITHPELEFGEKILKNRTIPLQEYMITNKEMDKDSSNGSIIEENRDNQIVPDCIGKDLREAISIITSKGIKPYAVGYGVVKKQSLLPGTKITPSAVCTLFCYSKG